MEPWVRYQWGFTALITGFVEYLSATFFALSTPYSHLFLAARIVGRAFPLLAFAYAILQWYVFKHYSFDEEPWNKFWSNVLHPFRKKLPHEKVYVRLKPSPVAGVGVF